MTTKQSRRTVVEFKRHIALDDTDGMTNEEIIAAAIQEFNTSGENMDMSECNVAEVLHDEGAPTFELLDLVDQNKRFRDDFERYAFSVKTSGNTTRMEFEATDATVVVEFTEPWTDMWFGWTADVITKAHASITSEFKMEIPDAISVEVTFS
jgi:hypothetical protein